ncbi:dephospho-CoA kinase [Phreatobacter aquaticus]|uniref:Dephospho-CoA kinase n=1 Tax=Phreatobacter aquaticus TaxID=2570229 RepID=A0A4D7QHH6_9HYPH|nr:dephospho-CoA kinase [Phreatobacter aquaticus]QCK85289.1 dephospho-CoA kinase [Phreatobacter aquaticus]
MFILGLTGSIGMGKSTTSGFFREAGIPVYDADAAVHRLYSGKAAPLIEQAFPGTTADGVVDRLKLGAAVLGNSDAMKRLESIIHPLVQQTQQDFRRTCREQSRPLVVLDIPLLFETGGDARVDAVAVVSAAPDIQRARVLARPGMTADKFEAILARQMADSDKRRRAHVVIDTGLGLEPARRQVQSIIRALAGAQGSH